MWERGMCGMRGMEHLDLFSSYMQLQGVEINGEWRHG